MNRRSWIVAGAGAAAAAAGVAWQLWPRGPGGDEAPPHFWTLKLPRPEGGELDFASLRGKPLLVNFWATWCAPCIKEMPDLDRFHRDRMADGWQVVGIAVDGPTPVREFLKKLPVGFPIALAGFDGADLSRELGNPQGALPFSVVFGADGRIRQRKLGQTRRDELDRWAASI